MTRASVWSSLRRSAIVPSAYVLTSLLAFVSVLACYLIWLAITIYIVLGPATRRLAIWSAPAPEPAEPSPSADASP